MAIIAHLDMDAFFAAVEERENPRWQGKPIVVGADLTAGRGRGVVSTANYAARAYGIHSALPITRAWRLSEAAVKQGKPAAIFLPVNSRLYSAISRRVMMIIRRFVDRIEQVSVDEAYFDISVAGNYIEAKKLTQTIKAEVKEREQLTCSIGIGPNKLIAKIAAGKNKPDGLTVIPPDAVLDFLAPLAVRELPGVGPKTGQQLAKIGINYIRELRRLSAEVVVQRFGKWGEELLQKAYGIGSTTIVEEYEAKSIGEQETFAADTLNAIFINQSLATSAETVMRRMEKTGFQSFRTLVITVRMADFQTRTRSHTLPHPTGDLRILKKEALKLLLPFFDRRANPQMKKIRLVGVRIEKLKMDTILQLSHPSQL